MARGGTHSAGGEVVTLQLGGGANHAGSHLWNLVLEQQRRTESQDFGVLLRESNAGDRLPRAAIFDLSGTVSTSYGSSAGGGGVEETWSSDRVYSSLPSDGGAAGAGDFSDTGYRGYWDEYLCLSPHSRWRSQLVTCFPGYWHKVNAFDCYGDGIDLFSREDVRDDAFDRVRRLVEDCDYLQGFQLLADDTTGFGHVCSDMLLHIRDEITQTKPLVVAGFRQDFAQDYSVQSKRSEAKKESLSAISRAWAVSRISEACDAHVIIDQTPPAIATRDGAVTLYDASALGACLVDSLTLGCRLRSGGRGKSPAAFGSLRDVVGALNPGGGRCKVLGCAYEFFRGSHGGPEARTGDETLLNMASASAVCPPSDLYKWSRAEFYVMRGLSRRQTGGKGVGGSVSTEEDAREWLLGEWKAFEEAGVMDTQDIALCPRAFVAAGDLQALPPGFPTALLRPPKSDEGAADSAPQTEVSSVIQFASGKGVGVALERLCGDLKRAAGHPSVAASLQTWDLGREDLAEMAETLATLREDAMGRHGEGLGLSGSESEGED